MSAMNGLSTLIRAGLVSAAIALVAPPVIAQEIDHSRMQMPAQKPMPNPPAESIDHTAMDHTGKDHVMGAKPSAVARSEEHTSELQSLMRSSYAVFCCKKKKEANNKSH